MPMPHKLLEAAAGKSYQPFMWSRLKYLSSSRPFFLAGALLLFALAFFINVANGAEATAELSATNDLTWRMATVPPNATKGLGSWIWEARPADKQTCRLWKSFEIPPGQKVQRAHIRMSADNGYRLFLDGRELGQGAEWRAMTDYDISRLLPAGTHILAVEAFNEFFQAGIILGMDVELANGSTMRIKSDESWRIVTESGHGWEKLRHADEHWPKATIVAALGAAPWTGSWPLDFVSVPQFRPIILPFWQTGWFHALLILICGTILLICAALVAQLTLQTKEQKLLHLERARIARDIHDDVGTRLTKLVLQGEVAQTELQSDPAACARFARISDGLRDVLGAMDEVLWAVNPRRDTLRDFVTYICEYAQAFLQPTSIQCLLEVEPDMPALEFDLPLRRSLLLAVKEAVNNAAKHSGASRLILQIHRREAGIVVIVEDNGKGFDLRQTTGDGNGLINMKQRMVEADGTCVITSEPGKGCRIEMGIPLTQRRSHFGWRGRRSGNGDSKIIQRSDADVVEISLADGSKNISS